ncbi:bifunctional N(6)-L-threonylcarbamoyladenine synthase/serine/threonine protein kinase [Candidatus Harpocratesius sp.]
MPQPFLCLGIESTAHTFSVGIVNDKGNVLGLSSDTYIPPKGGLKPTDVVEHHYNVFEKQLKQALQQALVDLKDIQLIAFSQGPGLGPCLRVGAAVARTLALKLKIPLVGVNHCIAHVEIGRVACNCDDPLTVYVSGGNTIISAFESNRYQIFGETIDISIGNLLDMVARDLGIPHPGGPKMEQIALKGKNFIKIPYIVKGMDLSFSGLYSYCRKMLHDNGLLKESITKKAVQSQKKVICKEDLVYSLQETAFSMIGEVCERAIAHTHKKSVLLTGGVAANRRLQKIIADICEHQQVDFNVVPRRLAGDNGAMIAWTGILQYQNSGETSIENSEIIPKWRMDDVPISWRAVHISKSKFGEISNTLNFSVSPNPQIQNLFSSILMSSNVDGETGILSNFLQNFEVIGHGAEAFLVRINWFEKPALLKNRIKKSYRISAIDLPLRIHRTITEGRLLISLYQAGIPVPLVYDIIPNEAALIMEFIEGNRLKDIIPELTPQKIQQYSYLIGEYLALMHNLEIAHGDLTTSNVILKPNHQLILIDFGLSVPDVGIEEKAMDIHLFQRVIKSSHGDYFDLMVPAFLNGYKHQIAGNYEKIIERVEKISLRGRYISKSLR